jgi:hypothetical protein
MLAAAQSGEPAETILGGAIREMLEAKAKSQQEEEKGGKA